MTSHLHLFKRSVGGNIIGGVIAALQSVLMARWLGPELFGFIGVIVAACTVSINFVDLRLSDLAMRRLGIRSLSAHDKEGAIELRILWIFQAVLACGAGTITLLGLCFLLRFLTHERASWYVVIVIVISQCLNYFTSYFSFIQRLGKGAPRIPEFQITASLAQFLLVIGSLAVSPTLATFAISSCASSLTTLVIHCYAAGRGAGGRVLFLPEIRSDFGRFKEMWHERKFLLSANVYGYAKLLHRGGDTLIVAALCSDSATGVYRLARSLTESFGLIYDALSKSYHPILLSMIAKEGTTAYRNYILPLARYACLAVCVVLLGEAFLLPTIASIAVGERYYGLTEVVLALTAAQGSYLVVLVWLWPFLLHFNLLGRYSGISMVVTLLAQYGAGMLLAYTYPSYAVVILALGHTFAAYGALIVTALQVERRMVSDG